MEVSRRSYALLRGVSEAAVRKSIATGRITSVFCRETTNHNFESLAIPESVREKLSSSG